MLAKFVRVNIAPGRPTSQTPPEPMVVSTGDGEFWGFYDAEDVLGNPPATQEVEYTNSNGIRYKVRMTLGPDPENSQREVCIFNITIKGH